jgi:translation initiation factor 1 (eIF-1/SUI1)
MLPILIFHPPNPSNIVPKTGNAQEYKKKIKSQNSIKDRESIRAQKENKSHCHKHTIVFGFQHKRPELEDLLEDLII